MKEHKNHIKKLVSEYKRLFPYEYDATIKQVKVNRETQQGGGAGAGQFKQQDTLDRKILEYPETLWTVFNSQLTPEGLAYLTTKEGARWFGKTYPEFSVTAI